MYRVWPCVRISDSMTESPLYAWRPVYRHSPEQIEKIRAAAFARKQTDETRKKIAEVRRGKPRSEETKNKISESHRKRRGILP